MSCYLTLLRAAADTAVTKAGTRDCHARYHGPEYGHTLWGDTSPYVRTAPLLYKAIAALLGAQKRMS